MRKSILTLAMALLCTISMHAQHRSESEAIKMAKNFFGNRVTPDQLSIVSSRKIRERVGRSLAAEGRMAAKNQSYYVVNDEGNKRFVIVSADERLYDILGYSDSGLFDADSIPQGLVDMLHGYDTQYDYLLENKTSAYNYKVKSKASVVVNPLIKTQWSQSSPYNNLCPEETVLGVLNLRTLTGCVATAMAQVMNYYQYPAQGQGYTSYTTVSNISQSMDFSSVKFDWNNMANTYDDTSSEEQKNAVAELMHACGVSIHTRYAWSESAAYSQDMAYALVNFFKYNPNIKYYERRYFSRDEWDAIIQEDLANGRPVLYSGMGESKNSDGSSYKYGHQFVLDGCNAEGKYHFNFGWSGQYDGYFELTAISPNESNDYTIDQAMVCNVSPQTVGKHEDIFFATAVLYDNLEVRVGNSISATFDPHCASVETNSYGAKFDGEFGIAVFDMNKNFVKSLYSKNATGMSTGTYYESLKASLYFDYSTFIDGSTYFIAPYAKASNNPEYTWMRTTYGLWDYYVATVNDGIVTLGKSMQSIPTGRVYASAFDANNIKREWQLTLTQDPTDQRTYWLDGFDPALSGSDNRVKGTLDGSGTQIRIPIGQSVGDGLTITNYTSPGDILISVSPNDSIMSIDGTWGTLKTTGSNDNLSQESYSQYSLTEMTFKYAHVVAPAIIYNKENHIVSMACATDEASIYYTTDGKQPSTSTNKYTTPVSVSSNCTIKAIAVKNGEMSDVSELVIKDFTVEKPVITVNNDFSITLSCPTDDADIYYTTDASSPVSSATRKKYSSAFTVDTDCTIKAIGVKDGYNNSEIVERYVMVASAPVVVGDNTAGQLEEKIEESDKDNIKELVVSGQLNGTDIAFIRNLIINHNLSVLDLEKANIVSGGSAYYVQSDIEYYTENDIIGRFMFDGCKKLSVIKLPTSAKNIEMFALSDCDGISELTIPCQNVGDFAIRNCKNLETIHLASGVQVFSGQNTDGCPKFVTFTVDDNNPYFISSRGVLFDKNKEVVVKYPMGKEDQAFIIPTTVTTIGRNAFDHAKVVGFVVPPSVTVIEPCAFSDCVNLTDVLLPNNVKTIGYMAFWNCRSLPWIFLPPELEEIESNLFHECMNLRNLKIGKKISKIAYDAFEGCTSLQEFNIDEENPTYTTENGILYSKDKTELKRCPLAYYAEECRIPDGVSKIESDAFSGCKNIRSVILPETITEIGSSAFANCMMTSINMPKNLTAIGYMAFWSCKQLETFIVQEQITEIEDYLLYDCDKLSYLEIPKGIKNIGNYALYGCRSLNTIRCHIEDIDGLNVERAYDGSYSVFDKIPADCTWYIPEGCTDQYKACLWWVPTWKIVEERVHLGIDEMNNDIVGFSWHDGMLEISANNNGTIRIYSIDGTLCHEMTAKKGMAYQLRLNAGLYLINNKKYIFR